MMQNRPNSKNKLIPLQKDPKDQKANTTIEFFKTKKTKKVNAHHTSQNSVAKPLHLSKLVNKKISQEEMNNKPQLTKTMSMKDKLLTCKQILLIYSVS